MMSGANTEGICKTEAGFKGSRGQRFKVKKRRLFDMKEAVIVSGVRTPLGSFNGALGEEAWLLAILSEQADAVSLSLYYMK